MAGIGYGFSNLVTLGLYGLAFWYGGKLMKSQTIEYGDFFVSFFSVMFAALGATEVGCYWVV